MPELGWAENEGWIVVYRGEHIPAIHAIDHPNDDVVQLGFDAIGLNVTANNVREERREQHG